MIRVVIWVCLFCLAIALAQKVIDLSWNDKKRDEWNKCRETGGSVVYCLTGLK